MVKLLFLLSVFLSTFFFVKFLMNRKSSSRKNIKNEEENIKKEIPEDVITPLEALTLNEKEIRKLRSELVSINENLRKTINGFIRTTTMSFSENDDFPTESIYEIKRLYIEAGWLVDLEKSNEYGTKYGVWKMKFELPINTKLPNQFTQVRVNPVVEKSNNTEISLEELGIDTLDQKFKNLEKKLE